MAGVLRSSATILRFRAATPAVLLMLVAFAFRPIRAVGEDEFKPLMQKAFELHQRGEFTAALPLLHRALAIRPDDYFVNLLLGIDSLRTGKPNVSIAYLKEASRLRPKEEYPWAYLGEAYARQSQFADAATAYMKAAEIAPGSAEASIAFVDFALARFGDISTLLRSSTKGLAAQYRLRASAVPENDGKRVELLKRAADLDSAAPGIWSELAEAAFAAGDAKSAAEDVHRALELDANDLNAWFVDAQLAANARDWKRANERLNAVGGRSPHTLGREAVKWPKQLEPPPAALSGHSVSFFACVRRAQRDCRIDPVPASPASYDKLFREQRWERVVQRPLPAINQSHAWLARGVAFAKLGDCAHAIPALERGVRGVPSHLYAFYELSRCYSEQAGRSAQQVQQSPENAIALHIMRGDIFLRLQAQPELASAEYEQAQAANPNDPSILERLAEAQFGAGKIDAARASAEAALKLDPQRAGAKRTLAKMAMQNRDYAAALPYLKELSARNPDDVAGRVELAKAYAQTGNLQEAWQNLAPALERGYPDEKGTLHYLLGTVLKKMGRDTDAERAFAKATELSEAFQQKSYRDQDANERP